MKTVQATLVMIKPDVQKRDLAAELYKLFDMYGLTIVAETTVQADLKFIKVLYDWDDVEYPLHIDKYLCSHPMNVSMVVGESAVSNALKMKKEFREKYQLPGDRLHTLIHCCDSSAVFSHE